MIRTCDPLIRSQVLYPAELRVHKANYQITNLTVLCQVWDYILSNFIMVLVFHLPKSAIHRAYFY